MKKSSLFLLIFTLTISCSSKKNAQNINRVWMLVEYKDYKKEYFVKQKAFLDMTNPERATSKMGCNNLSFSYKIDKSSITFSQGIATRMYCQDNMKLENDFLNEIPSMKNYEVEGHFLTLTSDNGEKISFVAQDWD